jgi:hypothetical protein
MSSSSASSSLSSASSSPPRRRGALLIVGDASDFAVSRAVAFRIPAPVAARASGASAGNSVAAFVVDVEADMVFAARVIAPPFCGAGGRRARAGAPFVRAHYVRELDCGVNEFLALRGYGKAFRPRTMWMSADRAPGAPPPPSVRSVPAARSMRAFVAGDRTALG